MTWTPSLPWKNRKCRRRNTLSLSFFSSLFNITSPELSCYPSVSENTITSNPLSLPFCHSTHSPSKTDLEQKYHVWYEWREEVWRCSQSTRVTLLSCFCFSNTHGACAKVSKKLTLLKWKYLWCWHKSWAKSCMFTEVQHSSSNGKLFFLGLLIFVFNENMMDSYSTCCRKLE